MAEVKAGQAYTNAPLRVPFVLTSPSDGPDELKAWTVDILGVYPMAVVRLPRGEPTSLRVPANDLTPILDTVQGRLTRGGNE